MEGGGGGEVEEDGGWGGREVEEDGGWRGRGDRLEWEEG